MTREQRLGTPLRVPCEAGLTCPRCGDLHSFRALVCTCGACLTLGSLDPRRLTRNTSGMKYGRERYRLHSWERPT